VNADLKKEHRLTLDILSAIESGQNTSQRRLSNDMGVALGLVNSDVKDAFGEAGWK
jgi:hypothetical protein